MCTSNLDTGKQMKSQDQSTAFKEGVPQIGSTGQVKQLDCGHQRASLFFSWMGFHHIPRAEISQPRPKSQV